ncbi:fam-c protein [Plasmodium vinckei lentum]|uniref:Fam-c protein n=1 Tax=Plasmodium vinckei lentum TaxID=138297 RepID=A0A6V7RUP9_PLAVN|nr:fam-c protein [Plasmodium vinckei lentum]
MNKRIFSLVCIVLYVLLAVSIHCSEEKSDRSKTYGLRSRIIRTIKHIKRSNKKNDMESQRETQLNNNNNNDSNDDKDDCVDYYTHYYGKSGKRVPWCCGLFYCPSDEIYD